MKRKLMLFALSVFAVVVTVGCSKTGGDSSSSSSSTSSSTNSLSSSSNQSNSGDVTEVDIVNTSFPATITINKGETIKWTNKDSMVHNVVFNTGGVSSGTLSKGDTFEHTFNETGTFDYVCTFHSGMKGKVVVQ